MKQREHFYDWTFTVSIRNLDNELVYVENAEMDLPGLTEILIRFLDVSAEVYKDFTTTMYEHACDTYSMQGAKGTDDPWVVIVTKNPEPIFEREGFWKKVWNVISW